MGVQTTTPPVNHKVSIEISVDPTSPGKKLDPPLENVGPQLEPGSELEPLRIIVFLIIIKTLIKGVFSVG